MALKAKQLLVLPVGRHADGNGLYLNVQPSGTRSWAFRFQLNGRRREMGLGPLEHTPAPEARIAAAKMQEKLRAGIDPLDERDQVRAGARIEALAKTTTFKQVAADFIESRRSGWRNAKHASQWANTLTKYAFPVIGNKAPAAITDQDVLGILKPIWDTKTETADRVRSRIVLVMRYAGLHNLTSRARASELKEFLDEALQKPELVKPIVHQPALPLRQLPAFMRALNAGTGFGARALEFAILNANRSGEVRGAQWHEIDLDARCWTIPASRMKAKRPHRVALSEMAVALLRKLPQTDTYVFPGNKEGKSLSDGTLLRVIHRMEHKWCDATGNAIVPHGFRSTFRDWVAEETTFPGEMAELALAHRVGDAVEQAYRRGDMFAKRLEMMDAWAAVCYAKAPAA